MNFIRQRIYIFCLIWYNGKEPQWKLVSGLLADIFLGRLK